MLLLEVKNSTLKTMSENQIPKTTKEKGLHGYGLEIVNKIAQKYNGKFILKSDGSTATASLGILIP